MEARLNGTRRWSADAGALLLLILLNLLLYRGVVRLWWTYDDANNLRLTIEHPFLAAFTDAAMWPQQLFTPLMMAAFEVQKHLFWLEAPYWYMAQLAATCIAVMSVYAAMRLFLPWKPALAAAATISAGVPLCSVVTQLSTVHYLIAITLAAAATIAYVRALRRGSAWLAIASALLYLAAMLSKEIAVTLPLLLVALPLRDFRSRLKHVIPHALAGIVYLAWRYLVLGTFLGAYGWKIDPAEWPRLIALLPWRVLVVAAGHNAIAGAALLLVSAIGIAVAATRGKNLLLLLVAAVVVFGPMLPLAKEINRRYVLIPWIAWSIAFAAGVAAMRNRRAANVLLVTVPLLAMVANRFEWRHEYPVRLRMSDEGRFLMSMGPTALMRNPVTPPAVLRELNWLKVMFLKLPSGASWFYDDFYLCANDTAGREVWDYDPSRRTMKNITSSIPRVRSAHCGAIRWDKPLTVEFDFREPALYWKLAPYATGKYSALLGEGLEAFGIPRRDALNLPGVTELEVRIRYDSPEGWWTYSPPIKMNFAQRRHYYWSR
jgi:hypothetical protein